jgi:hypothetical protein
MSMKRMGVGLVVLSLACVVFSGCGKGSEDKGPREVFDKAQDAVKKEDWKGLMATLTRESRQALTGGMVVGLVGLKQQAKMGGGAKVNIADVDAILAKHGVDEKAARENMMKLAFGRKPDAAAIIDLSKSSAAFVADGPPFVADALQYLTKTGAVPLDFGGDSKLEDLKIDGDKAQGRIMEKGNYIMVPFAKEDGAWKMDIIPMLMAGMR